MERESEDGTMPFLDVLLIKTEDNLKYKVYRKPTNKNDFVHFYSAHDSRTKTGIIIGFFLRAYRICSDDYLQDEITYIRNTFIRLKYPLNIVDKAHKNAKKIFFRPKSDEKKKSKYIIAPYRISTNREINIAVIPGRKISNLVKEKTVNTIHDTEKAPGVYRIPCTQCDKAYFGETFRGMQTRLKEHKYDMKNFNATNAMVNHRFEIGHTPDWKKTELIYNSDKPMRRKAFESVCISNFENINQNVGKFTIAKTLCKIIFKHELSKNKVLGNWKKEFNPP
jgi:hypothetical protein